MTHGRSEERACPRSTRTGQPGTRPAGEPAQPGPRVLPVRRPDLATPRLPRNIVEHFNGDLRPVNIQPAYDGHRDLLTLPRAPGARHASIVIPELGTAPARHKRTPPLSTSSIGRRDWGPHAEPLLSPVGFVPLYLGEPQLRCEAHRPGVRALGKQHHRLAGKRAYEPAECRRARLGGVPESPRLRQEQVAELDLPVSSRRTVPRCSPKNDLADHGSVEIDYEKAGAPLGRPWHLALELVTWPRTTEVGAHIRRGQ